MEFGKVPSETLPSIDFRLPEDPPQNAKLLATGKNRTEPVAIYAGCAKWGRPDWVGKLYPKGTKDKDYLAAYVKQFNSIELNATHYRIFDRDTVLKWKETAPDDFLFCPKFPQEISHWKRLKNAALVTEAFLSSITTLEDRLGPCFLQLHENFGPKNADDILQYLSELPRDFKVYLELRHKDWFGGSDTVSDFYEALTHTGTGLVITDTSGRRDCAHMRFSVNGTFIRFVGNSLHPTDYERMDEWVLRVEQWINQGIGEIYFFMHQHEELYSPELIKYFNAKLNARCGTQLKIPALYDQPMTLL